MPEMRRNAVNQEILEHITNQTLLLLVIEKILNENVDVILKTLQFVKRDWK